MEFLQGDGTILGISVIGVAAAILVFAVIAIIGLLLPKESGLNRRVRGLTAAHSAGQDTEQDNRPFLNRLMAQFYDMTQIEAAQKFATEWVAEHTAIGGKKRKLFLQAGWRQPRMLIYFEVGRALCGLSVAGLALYLLASNHAFAFNPALSLALLVFALFLGLYLPGMFLKRRIKQRQHDFNQYWDDAIGLLIICLDAGLSIEVAMRRIARELAISAPVLAEEFTITVSDLSFLKERRMAYLNLSERMDLPSVKSVTIALIQAEKQGASIASSLRTIAQTNRETRITRAEEKAASLGPKMTVPMIVFFLPVLFVIIIAPLLIGADK